MTDISVVRSGDEISAPLGIFYPNVVDVPLPAFLLHEDAKHHLSLEFDRQTSTIVGSNHDLQQALAFGLEENLAQLISISEGIDATNSLLGEISTGIEGICDQLSLVEIAVDRVGLAVRAAAAETVAAINGVSFRIAKLDETACLIADMTKQGELTWAREQAVTASRAMQVGDLEVAEQAIFRALQGNAAHVGAPTHVDLMLLAAEVLIRLGPTRSTEAQTMLDRARQYLALDPSDLLQGRFHFAQGSLHLAEGKAGGLEKYAMAKQCFERAEKTKTYKSVGGLYVAVAQSSMQVDYAEIGERLALALIDKPQLGVEAWRMKGNQINGDAVYLAIVRATNELNKKHLDRSDYYINLLRKTEQAIKAVEPVSLHEETYRFRLQLLIELKNKLLKLWETVDTRLKEQRLMSSFLIYRDFKHFDRQVAPLKSALGV